MTDPTIPTLYTDNRSKLGRLLAQYDHLHDRKKQLEALTEEADAALTALVDQIKAAANADPQEGDKLNLDHRDLRLMLRMSTFFRTEVTKDGKAWLQREHPDIWNKITETTKVTSLRQLTGQAWEAARHARQRLHSATRRRAA